jgi:hypothetical protein
LNDLTAPVADLANLPDVVSECEVTSLTAPTATDNCAGSIAGTHNAVFPISSNTTVTWTYTDGAGNSSTQTQNVVLNDLTAPVADLANLPDVVSECEVTSLTAPTATDNCDGSIVGTHNATFPITSNNTLTWTFVDAAGNTSTQTQEVIISVINVNVSVNEPTLTADNSESGVTYQWIDCDNGNTSIAGATSQSFTPDVNGNYAVVVTQGGCADTSACEAISTLSLNQQSISGFKLYPNPNNGQFTVESVEVVEQYAVVDVNGRLVNEGSPKSTSFEVNLDAYDAGIYYLHVNEEIMKVIKK